MGKLNYTEGHCNFETEHLAIKNIVENYVDPIEKNKLAEDVLHMLTWKVTEFLPDTWQEIKSIEASLKWIDDRQNESTFLCVKFLGTGELVGLIFIYESETQEKNFDLMFGYLLSEKSWGKGYGTELIKGLVDWCKRTRRIKSISGGVARNNTGSIRVLEKCGFNCLEQKNLAEETLMFKQDFMPYVNEE